MTGGSGGSGNTAPRAISVHDLKAILDDAASARRPQTPNIDAYAGAPTVIDVREPYEYADGHVPGAQLVPLMSVPQRVDELPADRPVYLICQVGARSAQAAEYLAGRGVEAVNVDGGTAEWVRAGYPLER